MGTRGIVTAFKILTKKTCGVILIMARGGVLDSDGLRRLDHPIGIRARMDAGVISDCHTAFTIHPMYRCRRTRRPWRLPQHHRRRSMGLTTPNQVSW